MNFLQLFKETEEGKRLMTEYGKRHDECIAKLYAMGAKFEDISIGADKENATVIFAWELPMFRLKVHIEKQDGQMVGWVQCQESRPVCKDVQ